MSRPANDDDPRATSASRDGFAQLSEWDECRHCTDPTWLKDATGPVHPCCEYWSTRLPETARCPSCAASKATSNHKRKKVSA